MIIWCRVCTSIVFNPTSRLFVHTSCAARRPPPPSFPFRVSMSAQRREREAAVMAAVWWVAVAVRAPWVLQGLRPGSSASWWSLPMRLAEQVSVLAQAAAVGGLRRLAAVTRGVLIGVADVGQQGDT